MKKNIIVILFAILSFQPIQDLHAAQVTWNTTLPWDVFGSRDPVSNFNGLSIYSRVQNYMNSYLPQSSWQNIQINLWKTFNFVRANGNKPSLNFDLSIGNSVTGSAGSTSGNWTWAQNTRSVGASYRLIIFNGGAGGKGGSNGYYTTQVFGPQDASNFTLTSQNPQVVSCQSGSCTAVGAGTTQVTVAFPQSSQTAAPPHSFLVYGWDGSNLVANETITINHVAPAFFGTNNGYGRLRVGSGSERTPAPSGHQKNIAYNFPSITYTITVPPNPNQPHTVSCSGITNITGSDARVNWTYQDPEDVQTNYQVQISTNSNFSTIFKSATAPANTNVSTVRNATITGLNPSTTYYARVRAYNPQNGWSTYQPCSSFSTLAQPTATLEVSKVGLGAVYSNPTGLNCGSTCTKAFNLNTSVTLTVSPATGYVFTGWTNHAGCNGLTGPCTTVMSQNRTITANFAPTPTYSLTVSKIAGRGTVTSNPAGINCAVNDTTCAHSFNQNTSVTLTPTAATGFVFTGWSGACTGTGACTTVMSQTRTVTANFVPIPVPTNVTATCSADSTQMTVSWTKAPGYNEVYYRAINRTLYPNPADTTWSNIIWNNSVTASSYTIPVTPGHAYEWWIHTKNGDNYSAAVRNQITCPIPAGTFYLTYNGNGATSGTMPVQAFTQGQTKALLANAFVRTFYNFIGWGTTSTSTVTSHANQANYTMGSANANLYARWASIPQPTAVTASCSGNGTQMTVSWTKASGYNEIYYRSINKTLYPDPADRTWSNIVYNNDVTTSSYTIPSTPGHTYEWWIHTKNGDNYSQPVSGQVTCANPSGTYSCLVNPSTYTTQGQSTTISVIPNTSNTHEWRRNNTLISGQTSSQYTASLPKGTSNFEVKVQGQEALCSALVCATKPSNTACGPDNTRIEYNGTTCQSNGDWEGTTVSCGPDDPPPPPGVPTINAFSFDPGVASRETNQCNLVVDVTDVAYCTLTNTGGGQYTIPITDQEANIINITKNSGQTYPVGTYSLTCYSLTDVPVDYSLKRSCMSNPRFGEF